MNIHTQHDFLLLSRGQWDKASSQADINHRLMALMCLRLSSLRFG
jgi:hypothetical protein